MADGVRYYGGFTQRDVKPTADSPLLKLGYTMAPGLSYDAAQYLAERRVVLVGLDTPFVDSVAEGQLAGKAPAVPGTPAGMAFAVHHHSG